MIERALKLLESPMNLSSLATPGIEMSNVAFASDVVVWLSCKLSAEERVRNLRHTKEVIGA